MVSLTEVQYSNSRITSSFPSGLVAVFVGATSGIGEYTLLQFAKYTRRPRIYFIGRSQDSGDRLTAECKSLNSEGEYIFVKADASLIRNVDDVCRDIRSKEKAINLLFLSTGTLLFGTKTEEDLHFATAVTYYSRLRFTINLLPLLQRASDLRRVVSVFAGVKEGRIYEDDFQGWKIPTTAARGHLASMITLSLESLAKRAPDVSFIHGFPGPVKSNLVRGGEGAVIFVISLVFKVIGPFINISNVESGERNLFLATSARYPAGTKGDAASGVPLKGKTGVARGINGESGSGVYSIDEHGENADSKVEELMAKMRKEGMVEKVWKDADEQFKRITGLEMA